MGEGGRLFQRNHPGLALGTNNLSVPLEKTKPWWVASHTIAFTIKPRPHWQNMNSTVTSI